MGRRGTKKRQRNCQIAVRLTEDEKATIVALAAAKGITAGELIRQVLLPPLTVICHPAPVGTTYINATGRWLTS